MPEDFDFTFDCSLTEDAALMMAEQDDNGLDAYDYDDEVVAYA